MISSTRSEEVDVHGVSPHEEHFRGISFRDLEGVNSPSAINDDQISEADASKMFNVVD